MPFSGITDQLFKTITELTDNAIEVYDTEGNVIYSNPAAQKTAPEGFSIYLRKTSPTENNFSYQRWKKAFTQCQNRGVTQETVFELPHGRFKASFAPYQSEADQYIICSITKLSADTDTEFRLYRNKSNLEQIIRELRADIEREKYHQKTLNQHRQKYQTVYDNIPVIIYSFDENGTILDVNNKWVEELQYRKEEVIGKTFRLFVSDEMAESIRKKHGDTVEKKGYLRNIDAQFIRKNGEHIDVELDLNIFKNPDNSITGVVAARNITRQKKLEKHLDLERNLNQTTMNALPGLVYLFDLSGKFQRWNNNLTKVSGYSDEEIRDLDPYTFIDENQREGLNQAVTKVFKEGSAAVVGNLKTKSGELIPYYFTGIRIEIEEQYYLLGVAIEIKEQMEIQKRLEQALNEQQILTKEIHHRVKNNMAIVSSLLSLQSEMIEDEHAREIFLNSQQRIQSMAMIHEMLYQHDNLASISMKKYIPKLTRTVSATMNKPDQVVEPIFDVHDIFLDLERAIPCGLVINELLTNSYKHAFNGKNRGTISISMHHVDDEYTLIIEDDGNGMPEELSDEENTTLGLTLLQGLVKQINGTWNCNTDQGTRHKIRFPVK